METVVTYSRSKSFSDRTLAKMRPLLKENGYCGYINLNTIVNQKGIWPLDVLLLWSSSRLPSASSINESKDKQQQQCSNRCRDNCCDNAATEVYAELW